MTQETILFTMTAEPPPGGEQSFLRHIDQIVAHGAGAALFSVIGIDNAGATLRGEVIHDPRTTTSEALEEYLEDILASKEGIRLNLSVNISAQGLRRPVPHVGSSTAVSAAQEEKCPDVAVINATRERLAGTPLENECMTGPDTRDENPPGTDGGYFLG